MSAMSATAEVPTGNTFDKYGSSNPVVKRLMAGFYGTLDELWRRAAPSSVLDVGCGEGVLTVEWAERLGPGTYVVRISFQTGNTIAAANIGPYTTTVEVME